MSQIRATTKLEEDNKLENNIKSEVKKLFNDKYTIDEKVVNKLRRKYNDTSVIEVILEELKEKKDKIKKIAHKFINKFDKKYDSNMPLHSILNKALKYKIKYKLSDNEFEAVKEIFENRIFNNIEDREANFNINTNLGRTLGSSHTQVIDGLKPQNDTDYNYIQDIIRINNMTKSLHSNIIIQTASYEQLDQYAIRGSFDINRHNPLAAINPVIVALFLPKIHEVERRMLYSNLAGIVENIHLKQPIRTDPDSVLLHNLIHDPSDVVCSTISPLKDLYDRATVQIQLWNNVYNLRQGKYYDASSNDFIKTIDNCKINNFDNPDLILLSDEGIILRRLFNMFAFRPIIVHTTPIYGNFAQNPYNLPVINNVITSIPYITFRIPSVNINDPNNPNNNNINLNSFDGTVQFFYENDKFVPKVTKIYDLYGPLIYYVPRKSVTIPIIMPFHLNKLPMVNNNNTHTNFTEINVEHNLMIQNNNYKKYLRSVVTIDTIKVNDNIDNNLRIIRGNKTFLIKYYSDELSQFTELDIQEVYCYCPQDVMKNGTTIFQTDIEKYKEIIKNRGTIFIYDD